MTTLHEAVSPSGSHLPAPRVHAHHGLAAASAWPPLDADGAVAKPAPAVHAGSSGTDFSACEPRDAPRSSFTPELSGRRQHAQPPLNGPRAPQGQQPDAGHPRAEPGAVADTVGAPDAAPSASVTTPRPRRPVHCATSPSNLVPGDDDGAALRPPTAEHHEPLVGNWHGLEIGSPYSVRAGAMPSVFVDRGGRDGRAQAPASGCCAPLNAAEGLALAIGVSTPRAPPGASQRSGSGALPRVAGLSPQRSFSSDCGARTARQAAESAAQTLWPPAFDETQGDGVEAQHSTQRRPDDCAGPSAEPAALREADDSQPRIQGASTLPSSSQLASQSLAAMPSLPSSRDPLAEADAAAKVEAADAAKLAADEQRTRAIASLQKPLHVVTRQKTLIRIDEKTGKRYVRWRDVVARVLHISRGASADDYALLLQTEHWLEACDSKHRYGSNIKPYFRYWLNSNTDQSFFKWLDEGDGKDIDLPDRPRERVERDRVWYCGWERCLLEVKIENGKFRHRIGNKVITTDSSKVSTPCPLTWRSKITADYFHEPKGDPVTPKMPGALHASLQQLNDRAKSVASSPRQSKSASPLLLQREGSIMSIVSPPRMLSPAGERPGGPAPAAAAAPGVADGPDPSQENDAAAAQAEELTGLPAEQTDEALLRAAADTLPPRAALGSVGIFASTGDLNRFGGTPCPVLMPSLRPAPAWPSKHPRSALLPPAAEHEDEHPAGTSDPAPPAHAQPPVAVSAPISIASRAHQTDPSPDGSGSGAPTHLRRTGSSPETLFWALRGTSSELAADEGGDVCGASCRTRASADGARPSSCDWRTPETDGALQRRPRVLGVSSIPTGRGLHMPMSQNHDELLSDSDDDFPFSGAAKPSVFGPAPTLGVGPDCRSVQGTSPDGADRTSNAGLLHSNISGVGEARASAAGDEAGRQAPAGAPGRPSHVHGGSPGGQSVPGGGVARATTGSLNRASSHRPSADVFDVHRDQVPQHVKDVMRKDVVMSSAKAASRTSSGAHAPPLSEKSAAQHPKADGAASARLTGDAKTLERVSSSAAAAASAALPPVPAARAEASPKPPAGRSAPQERCSTGKGALLLPEGEGEDLTDKVEVALRNTGQIVRVETQAQLAETLGLREVPPVLKRPSAASTDAPLPAARQQPAEPASSSRQDSHVASTAGPAAAELLERDGDRPEASTLAASDASSAQPPAVAEAAAADNRDRAFAARELPHTDRVSASAPVNAAAAPGSDDQTGASATVRPGVIAEEPGEGASNADGAAHPAAVAEASKARPPEPREKWIYVWDMHSRLYVNRKIPGKFHHSSFVAGGAVKAAGSIVIDKGELKQITTWSGHYRPRSSDIALFLEWLKDKGCDMSSVEILLVKPPKVPPVAADGDGGQVAATEEAATMTAFDPAALKSAARQDVGNDAVAK